MIEIGKNTIIGQEKVKSEIARILASERMGHAYLITGPTGVGKKALALAFAEAINGIENLSPLGEHKKSEKSGWFTHPDIHMFIPVPRTASGEELRQRIALLAEDPYAVVDFGNRPSLVDEEDSKNRRAFYHAEYYRDDIRPKAFFKPNEGARNIIILSNIETMRDVAANAFLKILEEPPENLMFIFTSDNFNAILPTIISRCQILRCNSLTREEIKNGLIQKDGLSPEDAEYLSRISKGNYAITRFFDTKALKQNRKDVIHFLRMSYLQDATEITNLISNWHNTLNTEGMAGILNLLEQFIHDIYVFMKTGSPDLITNSDQIEVIQKFVGSLKNANLEAMMSEIDAMKAPLFQNANPKLIFTVLSFRFGHLMRGHNTPIPAEEPWRHIPAVY